MNKETFAYIAWLAFVASIGLTLYLWLNQAFSLPLGMLGIVLMLGALFLQNESRR